MTKFNERDRQRIIQRYNDRLELHGATIATMASGTEERRDIRFKVLSEIGIQNGDSILDLGCGFGDFINYLERENISVDYTGYDINPALVEVAQSRFPEKTFQVKDILEEQFPVFDYVVSSSCFNLPLRGHDNYDFVELIMKKCFEHSRKGVAIDFLSSHVDFESAEGFHYDPQRLFSIAKGLTKRVNLRHDYPLFEFNIYLYKDFQGWSSKT
ncbi:class I SAM-dependent methyltransferase [Pseudomonadales bacterium]|nr:class I SAM-dependent methyltransferase [Pseudomonadales bacterium]